MKISIKYSGYSHRHRSNPNYKNSFSSKSDDLAAKSLLLFQRIKVQLLASVVHDHLLTLAPGDQLPSSDFSDYYTHTLTNK